MTSRLSVAIGLAAVIATATASQAQAARKAWIVVDAKSGKVLSSYRPDKLHAPASLTKVMTLYLTFEAIDRKRLRLNQRLRVSRRASYASPTKLYLRAGQTITVRQAILGLATRSANDAARVLAEALGGSEARFGRLMTAKARQLGMRRTVFRNASGLPARGQITTARDMAIMSRAIIRDFPHHYHYFGTRYFKYRGRTYANHNRLLWGYPGVDGIKTGYIRASGFNLITSAKGRNGRRTIAVVLGGSSSRDRDYRMTKLLNASVGKAPRQFASNAFVGSAPKLRRTQRLATRRTHLRGAAAYSRTRARRVRGRYAVQVGAYRSYRSARRAAYRAVKRARRHLAGGSRQIVRKRASRIYRARIYGLSKRQAYRACRSLRRKGSGCAIIRVRRG